MATTTRPTPARTSASVQGGVLSERVALGDDHAAHARVDQSFCAGRRLALVATRLERDVERRPARCRARARQGVDLGMGRAKTFVPAFAHELAVAHDHCADQRIRLHQAAAALGQFQGPVHPDVDGSSHAIIIAHEQW
jgi:hypothetical protein